MAGELLLKLVMPSDEETPLSVAACNCGSPDGFTEMTEVVPI